MLEFKFYAFECDQRYLLSQTVMDRLKHSPGFVGVHPGKTSATVIFETAAHTDEFLDWKKFAHVPIIRRGEVFVPIKDIPKSRRRKYKRYIQL